jgi:hypothetical protein
MLLRIGCRIYHRDRILDLTKVKSGVETMLSTRFGKELNVMG